MIEKPIKSNGYKFRIYNLNGYKFCQVPDKT